MTVLAWPRHRWVWCAAVLATAAAGCASGGVEDTGIRLDVRAGDVPPLDVPTSPTDAPRDDDAGTDTGPGCDDLDDDGFGVGAGCTTALDCDDADGTVHPEADELCNGTNDDCDGSTDEGFGLESCGVGACARTTSTCVDGVPQTCMPGAAGTETCNAIDDDCNGSTDEGFGMPITCGVGACMRSVPSCSGGSMMTCTPGTSSPETCNLIDDDCNGMVDDALGTTTCGVGLCQRTVANCVSGAPQACSPGPVGVETCNNLDDDCDGRTDETLGTFSCGFGRCVATAPVCVMGVPGVCTPNSGAARAEVCDSVDDDCNGVADDGIPNLTCGVGACFRSVPACITGVPQTCTPGSATAEICGDGIDQDCNGTIETAPSNSTCATAASYAIGSTVTGDNTCSNADHGASCGLSAGGYDVAYSFNSTGGPTRYTVRITGSSTSYDTVLHAHTSSACTTTDELACNDDFGAGNISEINIDSPPAGPVYLVADRYNTGPGSTFTMTSMSSVLTPDTCATAIPIRANGTYTGSTTATGITNNFAGPSCQTASGNDVVYSVTARASGTITVSTCGSTFDTVLSVHSTLATCGTSTGVACDDDGGTGSCGELTSVLSFAATAGTTYYVVVDGYAGGGGAYTLVVSGY